MKITPKRLPILLLWIIAATAFASAQDAENALKQYEGKILVLRHPLESSSHHYDADGHVLNHEAEGPWTVYDNILVDKIGLSPDKLRFHGRRILFYSRMDNSRPSSSRCLKTGGTRPFHRR